MTVRKLSTAEEEFFEAVAYYFAESPPSADRFIDEAERCLKLIHNAPNRYPIWQEDVRNKLFEKFPYSILYRIVDDEIVVVSYFHHKREPSSWKLNV